VLDSIFGDHDNCRNTSGYSNGLKRGKRKEKAIDIEFETWETNSGKVMQWDLSYRRGFDSYQVLQRQY
jgi:hypothetical protein